MEGPFFEHVLDVVVGFVAGFAAEVPGPMRSSVHRRGLKLWFGDANREHYEAQLIRIDGETALEIGFHAEHPKPEMNDRVLAALVAQRTTWQRQLGKQAIAGEFIGGGKWRRISETWPVPERGDDETAGTSDVDVDAAIEVAARLGSPTTSTHSNRSGAPDDSATRTNGTGGRATVVVRSWCEVSRAAGAQRGAGAAPPRQQGAVMSRREQTPWLPPRWFIRWFWFMHRRVYRLTRGRMGLWRPKPDGWGAARLTTTGRRSGLERSVIVGYFEDGPNLVTMAMNGWGEGEPAWWLNLQAHPDARVDLVDGPRDVTGRAAGGEERERLWARWREIDKKLDAYAARRSGTTAVVVLEPRA